MRKILAGFLILGLFSSVNAAVVTYGTLTSDDTTNYITDTVTGRLYTRFDAFDLSFADTFYSTAPGQVFDGWSVANAGIADDFYTAILGGTSACTGSQVYNTLCGSISGWVDNAFGDAFIGSGGVDYFAYFNDGTVSGKPIGLGYLGGNGRVVDYEYWSTTTALDSFSNSSSINLLLYKDNNAPAQVTGVAESSSIYLLAMGLFALLGVARHKQ